MISPGRTAAVWDGRAYVVRLELADDIVRAYCCRMGRSSLRRPNVCVCVCVCVSSRPLIDRLFLTSDVTECVIGPADSDVIG